MLCTQYGLAMPEDGIAVSLLESWARLSKSKSGTVAYARSQRDLEAEMIHRAIAASTRIGGGGGSAVRVAASGGTSADSGAPKPGGDGDDDDEDEVGAARARVRGGALARSWYDVM
jgi:hypothetical protein